MKGAIAVGLLFVSSTVCFAQTNCEKNISSAVFQEAQAVQMWPDYAIKWVSKHKDKYSHACFGNTPNAQSANYLLVFSTSQAVFNGFHPTVKTTVSTGTGTSSGAGSGTVTTNSGVMWDYTYSDTDDTTTTTAPIVTENEPYTDTADTLYVCAYDQHGKLISMRRHIIANRQGIGEPGSTLGYSLAFNSGWRGRLLKQVVQDIIHQK
jgi:hypothetical protein